jgi:queuine tRNA-ribosyltransferase
VKAKEILGSMLLTQHNLHHYQTLMAGIRDAIAAGRFAAFAENFHRTQTAPTPHADA